MATQLELLQEAVKRGLATPEQQALVAEAQRRGMLAPKETEPNTWTQAAKNVGEAGLQMGTGMVGQAAGLVAKYGRAMAPMGEDVVNDIRTKGEADKQAVQEALTYEPRSENAKKITEIASWPVSKVREGVTWLGNLGDVGAEAGDMFDATMLLIGLKGAARPATVAKGSYEHSGAVRVLEDHGVRMKLSQRGDGVGAAAVGGLSDAFPTRKFTAEQNADFTQATMELLDVDARRATPEVMNAKDNALGAVYEEINAKVPTKYDKTLARDLRDKIGAAVDDLGSEAAPLVRQFENIRNKVGPGALIDGSAAQASRASLQRLAKQETNPGLAHHASQLLEALNDALERAAPASELARLRKANQQYRILKQIQAAVRGESDALVKPDKLWTAVSTKKNGSQTIYGRGDQTLIELARSGDLVLNPEQGTGGLRGAIPATAAGVAATAAYHPAIAAGAAGVIAGSRILNHNQVLARALGGTGSRTRAAGVNKRGVLTLLAQAKTSEERKRLIELYHNAAE